jgi:hypothetical protein
MTRRKLNSRCHVTHIMHMYANCDPNTVAKFFGSCLSIATISTYAVTYFGHTSHVSQTSVESHSALVCSSMDATVDACAKH